jgi:hypothetical protein
MKSGSLYEPFSIPKAFMRYDSVDGLMPSMAAQSRTLGQNHRSFDYVSEFTNIDRPLMLLQHDRMQFTQCQQLARAAPAFH